MAALHKVFMTDGSTQQLTAEELEALDPLSYTAQEPPRPRFEVRSNPVAPDMVLYSVWDRALDDHTQVNHPSWGYTTLVHEDADAYALALNEADV